ncbi:MAG: ATP-binding cassette domain-containing protein [Bacteroidetes bacterium]|nr:MAG: ATP-binding cassette domain-containing protein [Bacteroidota bacterium]
MEVTLENTGKKYLHNWIFRGLNKQFYAPHHYGILGNNGSGKTTLLKIISGYLIPTEGKISWKLEDEFISETLFRYIGWASPHLELIEEFTLEEIFLFHQKFKNWLPGLNTQSLIQLSGLRKNADKPLKFYSSGMKQRVKLVLAVMSNVPLVLLDEPCSNLDENSVQWYKGLIEEFAGNRLFVIGSNDKENECFSCTDFITLGNNTTPLIKS